MHCVCLYVLLYVCLKYIRMYSMYVLCERVSVFHEHLCFVHFCDVQVELSCTADAAFQDTLDEDSQVTSLGCVTDEVNNTLCVCK